MSWLAWKLSGLPVGRVIGSGTSLDSSRFRALIADKLHVATSSVHGYIVGEHGDSSVPVWSGVSLGSVRLRDVNPRAGLADDPEDWAAVHTKVVRAAYEVIRAKGYTNWAIGLTVANLVECVLRNEERVLPVSTLTRGHYGIEEEVFLSLPCVVGAAGVQRTLRVKLDADEEVRLRSSAAAIYAVQVCRANARLRCRTRSSSSEPTRH